MEHRTVAAMGRTRWFFGISGLMLLILSFAAGYQVGVNNWKRSLLPMRVSLGPGLTPMPQQEPAPEPSPRQVLLESAQRMGNRMAEIYFRLQQYFYDPKKLNEEEMAQTAIRGLLVATGDRYTRYLKPEEQEQFETRSHGEYEGIGAELTMMTDPSTLKEHITIMGVFPEQPADKAGLRPLDRIVKIDGKPTDDMKLEQAVNLIRGPGGTQVTLTIQREGFPEPFDVTLTRQRIKIPVLRKRMLEGQVGYVRVLEFNEKTAEELSKALDELKGQGAKALILDLRNNPGGLLDAAVEVSSVFVPQGPVVTVKSRTEGEQVFEAIPSRYKNWRVPTVVMVNRWSASASEIVAGALKDHKIAEVVGEKTFGKASVQTVINLHGGGSLIVTTGSYLTPSGYDIHANEGLEPNQKLEPTAEEKQRNTQLITTWLNRGKQHLQSDELEDARWCFIRVLTLDKTNKEATKLLNETTRRLIERERTDTKDPQLEQVRQMLLQKLEHQKAAEAKQ